MKLTHAWEQQGLPDGMMQTWRVMRRWNKHAQATCDEEGRLVPCEDAT